MSFCLSVNSFSSCREVTYGDIWNVSFFFLRPLRQRSKSNYPSLSQKFVRKPVSHVPKFWSGSLSNVTALPPDQRLWMWADSCIRRHVSIYRRKTNFLASGVRYIWARFAKRWQCMLVFVCLSVSPSFRSSVCLSVCLHIGRNQYKADERVTSDKVQSWRKPSGPFCKMGFSEGIKRLHIL